MCSDAAVVRDKGLLRSHNSLLASYLDRFETIAEEVDTKGSRSEDPYLMTTANKLKLNVKSLRQVLSSMPAPQDQCRADGGCLVL